MQTEHLLFEVAGKEFAVPIVDVKRVIRAAEITPLPHEHPYIAGTINVSGKLYHVFSARKLLGVESTPLSQEHLFLLLNECLLWVDQVKEVIELETDNFEKLKDPLPHIKEMTRFKGKILYIYAAQELA